MILDSLKNIKDYSNINPNFAKAIDFILNTDLNELPLGRNEICGDKVFANVMEVSPKTKEEALIEIHRKYIDIQIPISAGEVMGYTPLKELPEIEFNEAADAALYPQGMAAREYFNVNTDEFVVFFPQDGHAPAITPAPMKKIVVKVAII